MAHSLHFNGTDLSGSTYGVRALRHAVSLLPDADVKVFKAAAKHGGFSQGGYLQARMLTVPIIIEGSSNDDLDDKLDALRLLVNPRLGDRSIRFDHQNDRYYLGRIKGDIEFEYIGPNHATATLQFVCADPLAYANSETTQSVTIDETPEGAAVPATGVVAGTEYAKPVWTIRNTSGSSVSSITVNNATTGEAAACTYTIPNNHYVRFDTARERLQYSADNSTYTDIMSYLSNTYKLFPRLAPGVANTITIGGLTGGTLTITYRARFL